ncbi:hypothetical protein BC629DRAFT_1443498 [Irpex lacteus]|nr:hypothetical protein BC629DRAFT_1443498 [Irpex lacteus]
MSEKRLLAIWGASLSSTLSPVEARCTAPRWQNACRDGQIPSFHLTSPTTVQKPPLQRPTHPLISEYNPRDRTPGSLSDVQRRWEGLRVLGGILFAPAAEMDDRVWSEEERLGNVAPRDICLRWRRRLREGRAVLDVLVCLSASNERGGVDRSRAYGRQYIEGWSARAASDPAIIQGVDVRWLLILYIVNPKVTPILGSWISNREQPTWSDVATAQAEVIVLATQGPRAMTGTGCGGLGSLWYCGAAWYGRGPFVQLLQSNMQRTIVTAILSSVINIYENGLPGSGGRGWSWYCVFTARYGRGPLVLCIRPMSGPVLATQAQSLLQSYQYGPLRLPAAISTDSASFSSTYPLAKLSGSGENNGSPRPIPILAIYHAENITTLQPQTYNGRRQSQFEVVLICWEHIEFPGIKGTCISRDPRAVKYHVEGRAFMALVLHAKVVLTPNDSNIIAATEMRDSRAKPGQRFHTTISSSKSLSGVPRKYVLISAPVILRGVVRYEWNSQKEDLLRRRRLDLMLYVPQNVYGKLTAFHDFSNFQFEVLKVNISNFWSDVTAE